MKNESERGRDDLNFSVLTLKQLVLFQCTSHSLPLCVCVCVHVCLCIVARGLVCVLGLFGLLCTRCDNLFSHVE